MAMNIDEPRAWIEVNGAWHRLDTETGVVEGATKTQLAVRLDAKTLLEVNRIFNAFVLSGREPPPTESGRAATTG